MTDSDKLSQDHIIAANLALPEEESKDDVPSAAPDEVPSENTAAMVMQD